MQENDVVTFIKKVQKQKTSIHMDLHPVLDPAQKRRKHKRTAALFIKERISPRKIYVKITDMLCVKKEERTSTINVLEEELASFKREDLAILIENQNDELALTKEESVEKPIKRKTYTVDPLKRKERESEVPKKIEEIKKQLSQEALKQEETDIWNAFFSTVFVHLPENYVEGFYTLCINTSTSSENEPFPLYALAFVTHMKPSKIVLNDLLDQIESSIRTDTSYDITLDIIAVLLKRHDLEKAFIHKLSIVCLLKFIVIWGMDDAYEYDPNHGYNTKESHLFPLLILHRYVQQEVKDTIIYFLESALEVESQNLNVIKDIRRDMENCTRAYYSTEPLIV